MKGWVHLKWKKQKVFDKRFTLIEEVSESGKGQNVTKDFIFVLLTYFDTKRSGLSQNIDQKKKSEYKYCTSKQNLVPSA